MFKLRTFRDVLVYAALISLVAMLPTATFVHFTTAFLPQRAHAFAMLLAIGLPLVIAFPVSIVALRFLKIITDAITKIEDFVKFDALTGVLARNYFMEATRQAFGAGGALLLVDADHFKRINDTHGHDLGDDALKLIGGVLSQTMPADGLVGRIGGEEFAVFLPLASREEAVAIAEAIRRALEERGRLVADRPIGITVSIGVAETASQPSLAALLKQADIQLYRAKTSGRNRVCASAEACEPDPVGPRRMRVAEFRTAGHLAASE